MILLFGQKASKSGKSSNIKNHPVENSGILANKTPAPSLLAANEYDMYMFSKQAEIDYSQYSDDGGFAFTGEGLMSDYASALAFIDGSDGVSYSAASFGGDFSCSCSCDCGSFVC